MRYRFFPFVLGLALASQPLEAEDESLTYLNGILSGTGVTLPDDPARYALYDSLETKLRELAAAIRNEAGLTAWYRLEIFILGDFIDLTQNIHDLMVLREDETLDEQSKAAITDEIVRLGDRGIEILSKSEFRGRKLFDETMLDAITEAFRFLPTFSDVNAVNTFLAILYGERSYLEAKVDSNWESPDETQLERDMLFMNMMLIDEPR